MKLGFQIGTLLVTTPYGFERSLASVQTDANLPIDFGKIGGVKWAV